MKIESRSKRSKPDVGTAWLTALDSADRAAITGFLTYVEMELGHILDATFGAATVEIIWAGASAAMPQPSPQYRIQNRVAAGINILRLIPLRPPIRLLPANPHLGQLPCHPEPVKSPDERHPDC